MRIAHITDIHWQVPPTLGQLTAKRFLGSLNLYGRGRHKHFTEEVQKRLIDHVIALKPDAVFITGDLTAQALDSEFEKAHADLAPLLKSLPTLIIPGNHDVYTPGAHRDKRIQKHFGEWMGLSDSGVGRLDVGSTTLLGLDPNRPHLIFASGRLPEEQLSALGDALADPSLEDRDLLLGLHHPPVNRRGELYDGINHGLVNAQDLVDVLESAPKRPAAILCGHVHHGFRSHISVSGVDIPVLDCGSSGYAWLPKHDRAAAMGVYEFIDGELSIERYIYDGHGFAPEAGGPFASGR